MVDPRKGVPVIQLKNLRLTSGFFADDGKFFFLRQDVDRASDAFNLWSLRTDSETGAITGRPVQLSHLKRAVLSQLTGAANGGMMSVVRTECPMQTYVAGWQATPHPMLQNPRRLTLERTSGFPHAFTPDNQSVILESDRNGHLEIFRQKLTRTEAELLVSTPGDLYMPSVTPDGKWLLLMFRETPTAEKPDDPSRHRLVRAPIDGGKPVEVPIGGPLDEFRCSQPSRGTGCVLRTTEGTAHHFFELDPISGKGRELGRTPALGLAWDVGLCPPTENA